MFPFPTPPPPTLPPPPPPLPKKFHIENCTTHHFHRGIPPTFYFASHYTSAYILTGVHSI